MTEIIARKKSIEWLYFIAMIVSVLCIVLGTVLYVNNSIGAITGVFLAICGVNLVAISAYIFVKVLSTPKVLIVREGDALVLPDGKFRIKEMNNVNCTRAHSKGIIYRWGALILTINGYDHTYDYIADVERVQNRILELMLESRNPEPDYNKGMANG